MKYRELARIVKADIDRGGFRQTDKLPTEDQMMEQYGVTRYCVRNAVALLAELGDVYPVQGSGVFVRESKREGCMNISSTKGMSAEFVGHDISSKVLSVRQREAGDDATRLKVAPQAPLHEVRRLRLLDGEIFALEWALYLKEFVPYLSKDIARGSIYSYVHDDLGLVPGFADKVMYARKLDADEADVLGLAAGDPTLVVEDDAYLANGRMFNAGTVCYHYQKARFFNLADLK